MKEVDIHTNKNAAFDFIFKPDIAKNKRFEN